MEEQIEDSKAIINIAEISKYTTFILIIGFTYSISRTYFYYVLSLHVPVFQYLDVSDILLNFPSQFFFLIQASLLLFAYKIVSSTLFIKPIAIFYCFIVLLFMLVISMIVGINDEIIAKIIRVLFHNWILDIFLVFILFVFWKGREALFPILRKYSFFIILAFTVGCSIIDSTANYYILVEKRQNLSLVLKLKDGSITFTTPTIEYAGRTKNYWFFYNQKTGYVRVIKNDDVSLADFDTKMK